MSYPFEISCPRGVPLRLLQERGFQVIGGIQNSECFNPKQILADKQGTIVYWPENRNCFEMLEKNLAQVVLLDNNGEGFQCNGNVYRFADFASIGRMKSEDQIKGYEFAVGRVTEKPGNIPYFDNESRRLAHLAAKQGLWTQALQIYKAVIPTQFSGLAGDVAERILKAKPPAWVYEALRRESVKITNSELRYSQLVYIAKALHSAGYKERASDILDGLTVELDMEQVYRKQYLDIASIYEDFGDIRKAVSLIAKAIDRFSGEDSDCQEFVADISRSLYSSRFPKEDKQFLLRKLTAFVSASMSDFAWRAIYHGSIAQDLARFGFRSEAEALYRKAFDGLISNWSVYEKKAMPLLREKSTPLLGSSYYERIGAGESKYDDIRKLRAAYINLARIMMDATNDSFLPLVETQLDRFFKLLGNDKKLTQPIGKALAEYLGQVQDMANRKKLLDHLRNYFPNAPRSPI